MAATRASAPSVRDVGWQTATRADLTPHFNPDDITRHVGVYNKRGLRPDMEYGTALLY